MNEITMDTVRDLIERHSDHISGNTREFYNGAYAEIADELNRRAERTCKIIEWYEARDRHEIGNNRVRFSCGDIGTCHDKFCPECGARVVR